MSRAVQGLRAWLLQRFTAVFLAACVLALAIYLPLRGMPDYAAWHDWFARPWMGVLTAMFALAVLLHVWVGMRDVLIDYVHAVWLRLLLLAAFALVLLASLLWVMRALALAAVQGSG